MSKFESVNNKSQQKGYSLIELLIAMGLGIALTSAVTLSFTTSLGNNADGIKMTQLNEELAAAMSVMTREIKRAGYSSGASGDAFSGANTNPFTNKTTGEILQLWSNNTTTTPIAQNNTAQARCITFAYDGSATVAATGAIKASDFRGFRWDSTNKRVQVKTAAADTTKTTSCSLDTWTDLTSPDISITDLSFYFVDNSYNSISTDETSATVQAYTVKITLTGTATLNGNVLAQRSLEQTINVRNNQYTP